MAVTSKPRIDELDILKDIAILLMILYYCLGWGQEIYIHKVIQSFHMPLFFIVGGYLWKAHDERDYFRHKVRTILGVHFNFAVLYSLVLVGLLAIGKLSGGIAKSVCSLFLFSTKSELTMFASPIWFLQEFFLTCVVFTHLKLSMEKHCGFVVATIVMTGIIYSELCEFVLPFALEPFCTGILFFFIGYRMKSIDCFKLEKKWMIIPVILVWLILVYLNGCIEMRSARYYNPALYIVNGVLGTVIFWNIARWIGKSKISEILKHFSIYSISYLCTHYFFVYYGVRVLDKIVPWTHTGARFILFWCVLGISWVANRTIIEYVPWLVGRKKPTVAVELKEKNLKRGDRHNGN